MLDLREHRVSSRARMPRLGAFSAVLAAAAFSSPLWAAEPERASGLLLLIGALSAACEAVGRETLTAQGSALSGAAITLVLALLLLNAPWFATRALGMFVAVPFALDALRYSSLIIGRTTSGLSRGRAAAAAFANLAVVGGVFIVGRYAPHWVLAAASGVRLVQTAVDLLTAPIVAQREIGESVVADVGIDEPERLAETGMRLQTEE